MKITITMLPNVFAYPIGGNLVGLEYANRLVARGHEVVIACVRPTAEVIQALGLQGILVPPVAEEVPQVSWFSVDPRVAWTWYDVRDNSTIPDGDVLLNAPGLIDSKKGLCVGFIQGFGVARRELEDDFYLGPGPKICVSRWVYDELRARGVPPENLRQVSNGVDTGVFRITRPVEGRPPRVAMLHHYLPVKGTDLGLSALEHAKSRVPELQAVLFGIHPRPGDLPDWIEYVCRPSRAELSDLYNSCAILVCPSRGDGFYLCGLEAMACGCALASTDFGGVHDYATNGVTALLAPPEDASALGDHVIALATQASLRSRIAAAGAERATEFSWEHATDRLLECFQSWLHQRAPNAAWSPPGQPARSKDRTP